MKSKFADVLYFIHHVPTIFEEKAEAQDQNPLSLNPVQKADDLIEYRYNRTSL